MANFDWTWLAPTLGVLGFGLSVVNFVRTWNTVRVEEEEGEDGQWCLQVFNDSPHAVTVIMIGPISGTGFIDTDRAHMRELCPRTRIEARDTVTIPVHEALEIQSGTYELIHGRVGWWVRLSTQQMSFTHPWLVRWLWRLHDKAVSGLDRIGSDVIRQEKWKRPMDTREASKQENE